MIIGVDEVGRGAWAGPLLVAAVQLPELLPDELTGLTDSKKLSKVQRERYAVAIYRVAIYVGFGWVTASEVDELGLTAAMRLACQRAVEGAPDAAIIIDGQINYLPDRPATSCQIKADRDVPAVSAASIVAKVARDNYMADQAKLFPQYGFDRHVGYGTQLHSNALARHGTVLLHRKSFKPVAMYTDV